MDLDLISIELEHHWCCQEWSKCCNAPASLTNRACPVLNGFFSDFRVAIPSGQVSVETMVHYRRRLLVDE